MNSSKALEVPNCIYLDPESAAEYADWCAETAAPGTQAELGALMRAWAEGGAACPAD